MKILMFTPYVPYPPNSGGQTRTFNLIKNLSKKHEIVSFCFLRTDQPEPDLTELQKYCQKVKIFRRKKAWDSLGKIVKTGVSTFPYLVNMYSYDEVKMAMEKELQTGNYDLIHVETYYILPNIPQTQVPVLLSEQTIEYLVYQHYTQTTKLLPLKPLLYVDVWKHKYWEKLYWQKVNKVVAMSDADRKKMLELLPNLDVGIVPNGVDIDFFNQKIVNNRPKGSVFLFQGNFNWLQNREAVDVLVSSVWPRIKSVLPESRLWIVGRSPNSKIKSYEGECIKISSDVDDIRFAYQGSDVLICPLYGGGGTRYKILEAMASKLPVVSTKIGIEGLEAKNGVHALIDNNSEKLADLAVSLIKDKKLANNLAKNAFELVKNNFDWDIISTNLEKIYAQTAKKGES